jgi:hypothetical protein
MSQIFGNFFASGIFGTAVRLGICSTASHLIASSDNDNDKEYSIQVADDSTSDAKYINLLRAFGNKFHAASEEDLKNVPNLDVFNRNKKRFKKEIWSIDDMMAFINNVVDFCCVIKGGIINPAGIKAILSKNINLKVSCEEHEIDCKECVVIYTNKTNKCGVVVLTIKGKQEKVANCCASGAKTEITVKKTEIMFENTKDLKLYLESVEEYLKKRN